MFSSAHSTTRQEQRLRSEGKLAKWVFLFFFLSLSLSLSLSPFAFFPSLLASFPTGAGAIFWLDLTLFTAKVQKLCE